VDPANGQSVQIFNDDPANNNPFQKDFCTHYGINTMADIYQNVPNNYFDLTAPMLLQAAPDDIATKATAIGAYLGTEGPKLIYSAKTDADFKTGQQAIIDKINSMGWADVYAFWQNNWMTAATAANAAVGQ